MCLSKRETVFLNLDPDFEYRPDHYEEVKCAHEYDLPSENKIRAAVIRNRFRKFEKQILIHIFLILGVR